MGFLTKRDGSIIDKIPQVAISGDLDLGLVTRYDTGELPENQGCRHISMQYLAAKLNRHRRKQRTITGITPHLRNFQRRPSDIPRPDQLYFLIGTRHSNAYGILDSEPM